VGDHQSGVLIDCGISTKRVLAGLDAAGLSNASINAVLITHEHADHVGGAAVLSRRLQKEGRPAPFFMTEGTAAAIRPKLLPDGTEIIAAGEHFSLRHLQIDPFPVPHDTAAPVAYRVGIEGRWAGVVTDLGRITTLVSQKVKTMSAAVIEFNHDEEMLLTGDYPWPLKQRIRSSHGHLSNHQAAELLRTSTSPDLTNLVLAHLSDENNQPDLAMKAAVKALSNTSVAGKIDIQIGLQGKPNKPIEIPLPM